MSKIFGGSKSKSQQTASSQNQSGNLAFGQINEQYNPAAASAFNSGVAGVQQGLAGGYDAYKANTGFDFFKALGLRRTAGDRSGRGLFNSGATMRALANYENEIGNASYDGYLAQQAELAKLGLAGGNLIAGAGQFSTGTSQSQGTSKSSSGPGIGGFLGSFAGAAAASDERLKMDITKLGEHEGLGVYQYTYISGQGPYIGYMAQEVQSLYPEAMGPERAGYLTVDYGKLAEVIGEFNYDELS